MSLGAEKLIKVLILDMVAGIQCTHLHAYAQVKTFNQTFGQPITATASHVQSSQTIRADTKDLVCVLYVSHPISLSNLIT